MHVLVIGSGGREHALAWAISRSPQVTQVWVANGNGGTVWHAQSGDHFAPHAPANNVAIAPENITGLLEFARNQAIGLTVVGPEVPLALGIVNRFQEAGLRVFGPTQACARLEASKAFSKQFMTAHAIPTAPALITNDWAEAQAYIRQHPQPLVIKADGLAAGKGVIVCDTPQEALDAVQAILIDRAFGDAGQTVIIEDRLQGRELSVLAFCDGQTAQAMPVARDHKRALDGDQGLNTGGMGAIAPASDIAPSVVDEVMRRVIQPALDGMAHQGTPYVGVLYAGIMLTEAGIMTLEFNCRFGDPETQVILPLLKTDIITIFNACIDGTLADCPIVWRNGYTATIVLASGGYPEHYRKGIPIDGLDRVQPTHGILFHAGTVAQDGQILTNGGRVLNVTSYGDTLEQALHDAYQLVHHIAFDGMHYRTDIGRTLKDSV